MKNSIFNLRSLFILLAASLITISCKKDEEDEPIVPEDSVGVLELDFDHLFGSNSLEFGREYTNGAGEKMTFTMFKYFVTNLQLVKEDNSIYEIPAAYRNHIIDHAKVDSRLIRIPDVPTGTYKAVRFILGVDSITNTLPVEQRTGVFDVSGAAQGMYWSWNSGYIFVKVEGNSPASPEEGGRFRFHIGGFGGYSSPTINNIKTIDLVRNGGLTFTIQKGKTRNLHIEVDLRKMFVGSEIVSVATNSTTMFNPYSVKVADNYSKMFKLDHIH
jgi:hypothetical protein